MVYVSVNGAASKLVEATKTVAGVTGVTSSNNRYLFSNKGYVATSSVVVDGAKYYTNKEYVKFTAGSHVNADNFTVAYSTVSGTVLTADSKGDIYVAVGETVVTTLTAKANITNPGSTATTKFKIAGASGTMAYAGELEASAFDIDTDSKAAESTIDTANAIVVARGDVFTLTADAKTVADTPYTSPVVTVTNPAA